MIKSLSIYVCLLFSYAQNNNASYLLNKIILKSELSGPSIISISGVGDMMIGTNYPNNSHLPPNDGKNIFEQVQEYIQSTDIAFGNLEGVLLSDSGDVKRCSNPKLCYAFKSPNSYVNHFKKAGFDLLSIANNHINDFGQKGRENTVRLLDSVGIHYAGLMSHPYKIFNKNNVTYGFTAFAPNTNTMQITDYKKAQEIVHMLDSLCDIVIVSFHGGAEGRKYNHITKKTEKFVGENRGNPYEFARKVIDSGADIVLGHGPHVTRAVDIYKNRFIAYSLGNFATYDRFNLSGLAGIAPIVDITVSLSGVFLTGRIIPIQQIGRGKPVYDKDKRVIKEIIELIKSDIPESRIHVSEDGKISQKLEESSKEKDN